MLKVLLVDDEPFILQGLKLLVDWEKEGFRVAGTAANGMEALAFLKKEKVDLVIADIKMPQMTGLELLEHIRKEKISDAYFVILSGYAEFSFAQQAMQNDLQVVAHRLVRAFTEAKREQQRFVAQRGGRQRDSVQGTE